MGTITGEVANKEEPQRGSRPGGWAIGEQCHHL